MIALIFAIIAAWLLIEFGAFVLALIVAAFGRWKEARDAARAVRWWGSLTIDEQAEYLERIGHASEANILRAWDAHKAELPL